VCAACAARAVLGLTQDMNVVESLRGQKPHISGQKAESEYVEDEPKNARWL